MSQSMGIVQLTCPHPAGERDAESGRRVATLFLERRLRDLRWLPRPRMGSPGHRRRAPVREDQPGRVPGRPELDHHPQEARDTSAPASTASISTRSRSTTTRDVERLLADAGIVRHRGKIEAAINNAGRAIELQREFGSLARYFWQYEVDARKRPKKLTVDVLRTFTTAPEAIALSKDLKKRGWKFVGPTTMYAFMQAMGLVNDHQHDCHVRGVVTNSAASWRVPEMRQKRAHPGRCARCGSSRSFRIIWRSRAGCGSG